MKVTKVTTLGEYVAQISPKRRGFSRPAPKQLILSKWEG